jgi:hypothetical protein
LKRGGRFLKTEDNKATGHFDQGGEVTTYQKNQRGDEQVKRILGAVWLIMALAITLALVPAAYAAAPIPQLLDRVDIGDPSSEATHDVNVSIPGDWGIIIAPPPGPTWGGLGNEIPPGNARVVWEKFGPDPVPQDAHLTLDTGGGFARHIKMRVMEGFHNDSFNVYVKNPADRWVLVYSYVTAPSTTETWLVHHIFDFPAGKGQGLGTTVEVKIEATVGGWPFGQLAVDWVEVWDH